MAVSYPSIDERYGADDRHDWYAQTLVWDKWAIDVSFSTRETARRDSRSRRLTTSWFSRTGRRHAGGTNLEAYAPVQRKPDIANQAKRSLLLATT
jgi:hypothetical protein